MNKNEIMNAKLSNKFSKIKQTRTTPKLLAFSKILALSLLLLSVLVAKFNDADAAAIAIVGDNKENGKEVVSIAENNVDNNDAEGAKMMATASSLQLLERHKNKAQKDDGTAASEWQKLVGNRKLRQFQQKRSLTA